MSAIPSWAVRGAKVVCVVGAKVRPGAEAPVVGATYIISAAWMTDRGNPAVSLKGLCNTVSSRSGNRRGYHLARFRPLVSTKSEAEDAALFSHHLTQKLPESVE